jgi:hypothetical protein
MKQINRFLFVAVFGTALAAFGADFMVTGVGVGTDSDRSEAQKQAYQEAVTSIGNSCPVGRVQDMEVVSSVCSNTNNDPDEAPSYRCSITLQGKCHTKSR